MGHVDADCRIGFEGYPDVDHDHLAAELLKPRFGEAEGDRHAGPHSGSVGDPGIGVESRRDVNRNDPLA